MTPEEVDRFTRFNEAADGPSHRLVLQFESAGLDQPYAVILLNEDGLRLENYISSLNGQTWESSDFDPPLNSVLRLSGLPAPGLDSLHSEAGQRIPAWTVLSHGRDLLIALKSVPSKLSKSSELPLAIGIVITGKQNMRCGKIVRAEMLPKDTPTPFIADEWGDTYNDSFDLEPRIIESVPTTVFEAVENIMAVAKKAFSAQNYEVAAIKYRKAFHYCHKYYPESLSDDDLQKATELKLRSLLNLALAGLRTGMKLWFERAIEATDFVLDMPEATDLDRARAYNRRGRAKLYLGDDETAKSDLEQSLALHDDENTRHAIKECNDFRKKRLVALQDRMRGAFQ